MTAVTPITQADTAHAVRDAYETLRDAYRELGGLALPQRLDALRRLADAARRWEQRIADAIDADFGGRSRHETAAAEIYVFISHVAYLLKHLPRWVRPRKRHIDLIFRPASNRVLYQPLGVVGVISPWNYPFQLAMVPIADALAAGNRVLLKPSELTLRTSQVLAELLTETFPSHTVQTVTGGPEVGVAFSKLPFDHLLFTGSTAVGRHVMRAAADNLTPVTLELGGKSPVILHESYPLAKAAERVAVGKLFNAGQTCIAPDYVLCPEDRVESFARAFGDAARRLYPTIADNPDYSAIINERHHARLRGILDDARDRGATVTPLYEAPPGRRMAPTVVTGATDAMAVLQEELFGPILPIVPYGPLDEAIAYVNDRPRPLALYYFDHDRGRIQTVLERTVSGGAAINDTMLHVAQDDLPFGGVGPSGMGAYHGREGFETFSHQKAVFQQARINGTALLSPPYGKTLDRLLNLLIGRR